MKPTDQEVSNMTSKMLSLFKMTTDEAQDHAIGFIRLAYGWGSPPSGAKLEQKIKKDLSKDYEWRSNDDRISFEASETRRLSEQDLYISNRSSPPKFR